MRTFLALALLAFVMLFSGCAKESSTTHTTSPTGISGSLSRFTIVGNRLFCLDGNTLKTFDITNGGQPVLLSTIELSTEPETIFSYTNFLLMGTSSGMLIYSVADNPAYVSTYEHIVSCDPVVAENGYAYVTLRNTTNCNNVNGASRLEVISLANMSTPEQVAQLNLMAPYGLAVNDTLLFVADEELHVQVISISNRTEPYFVQTLTLTGARDVIALPNLLLVMAEKKLAQYDYSNVQQIQLISQIDL